MKGWISGIKRMEIHDGDGLRTTVFFKGCPLKCLWCHNPESIAFTPQVGFFEEKCIHCNTCRGEKTPEAAEYCPTGALTVYGKAYDATELAGILEQDAPFFRNGKGGVTLSGGECLAQPDFALELTKLLREKEIPVDIDTCGFVKKDVLEAILPFADTFLYDIKAVDPAVHKTCTGQDNRLILDNLIFLSEKGCRLEIRYPLVMGYNDGECDKIGAFLSGRKGISKVKVLPCHLLSASRYKALGMENTLPKKATSFEEVETAVKLLQGFGLPAVNGMLTD